MDRASLGRVRAWLETQGLTIQDQAVSRTWIAFSGTAAQIDAAFHTALHDYRVDGQAHFAPSNGPSVPAALQPAVLALRGLDDFLAERSRRTPPSQSVPATALNGRNALAPADLEVIYGIAPLHAAGFDGTGQTIAVVGRSNVDLTDL
jgi:subtilase family serine protease